MARVPKSVWMAPGQEASFREDLSMVPLESLHRKHMARGAGLFKTPLEEVEVNREAVKRARERLGAQADRAQVKNLAQYLKDKYKKQGGFWEVAQPEAWKEATAQGATLIPQDVIGTATQRRKMRAGVPVALSKQQVARTLAQEAAQSNVDPETVALIAFGKLDDLKAKDPDLYDEFIVRMRPVEAIPDKLGAGPIAALQTAASELSGRYQAATGGAIRAAQEATAQVPLQKGQTTHSTYMDPRGEFGPKYVEDTENKQLFGVPLESADQAIKPALRGAAEGMKSYAEGWTDRDLDVVLEQTLMKYKREAVRHAREQLGPEASPDQIRAAAQANYETFKKSDAGQALLENPQMTRLAHELVVDPLNLASPFQLAGKAAKSIKPVGKAMQAGKEAFAASGLGKGFLHMPELAKLDRTEEGKRLASMLRLGEAQAVRSAEDVALLSKEYLEPMNKLMKTDADKKAVADALEGLRPVDELASNQLEAYELGRRLGDEEYALMEKLGVERTVDTETGKIIQAEKQEHYLPRRVFESTDDPAFYSKRKVERRRMDIGAARERVAEDAENLVKDPILQHQENLKDIQRMGSKTGELKNMDKVMREGKFIREFTNPEEAASTVKALNKVEGGIEYTVLDSQIAAAYERVTGKLGQKVGKKQFVVPTAVAERIDELTKAGTEQGEIVKALSNFNRAFLRPTHKIWRTLKTIPRLGHHVQDTMGAVTLGYLAHGVKGFSPSLQRAALATGIAASTDGTKMAKRLRNMKVTLGDGSAHKLDDIMKEMDKAGVLNLFEHRLGLDLATGQTGEMSKLATGIAKGMQKVEKGVEKATELAQMRRAAQFTDNYQHSLAFIGALDNLEPQSVAKALDFMSEYAGNFKRLGKAEKAFMKDAFGFYSWMRFIVPRVAKSAYTHPNRIANAEKIMQAVERKYGKDAPVSAEGIPEYARMGATAPRWLQNPRLREYVENPDKIPEPGSHEFTMLVMETPLAMALPYVKNLAGEGRYSAGMLISALPKLAQEFVLEMDIATGSKKTKTQALKDFGRGFVDVPAQGIEAMAELYKTRNLPEGEIDWRLRLAAYRWFAGIRAYQIQPVQTVMGKKKEAIEKVFPETRRQLAK